MKHICRRKCQVRIDGQITFVHAGDVVDMTKEEAEVSGCFESVEDVEVNFATATAEELMAAKWKFIDAAKFAKKAFDIVLNKADGKKADVVEQIMDARYRKVD